MWETRPHPRDTLGKHHTEEARRKMSLAHQGHVVSIDTRKKISEANKGNAWNRGRHHTGEARKKMSKAQSGVNHPFFGKHLSGEHKKKLSEALKGEKNPAKTSEARKKISEALKGEKNPCYGKHLSEEMKIRISKKLTGKHFSENHNRKISEWRKGKHHTEETRKKMSEAHIRAVKMGCYTRKPTAPEKKFIEICTKYNLPFKYVGDGKFWIENVNPDFVESNGRKIAIEIYGDYWHTTPKIIWRDGQRAKTLEKYGWRRFVVWEHELKELHEDVIVKKICQMEV